MGLSLKALTEAPKKSEVKAEDKPASEIVEPVAEEKSVDVPLVSTEVTEEVK